MQYKLCYCRSASVEHKNEQEMLNVVKVFHNHKRQNVDMILIVGSDKSPILQAGKLFPQRVPPLIKFSLETQKGVRRQTFCRRQMEAIIQMFGNPERKTVDQLRLDCTIFSKSGNPSKSGTATNEVSIHRGDYAKAITFDVLIGSKSLTVSGDGIVVGTPFGSTAYTQALGGSILDPKLACIQV